MFITDKELKQQLRADMLKYAESMQKHDTLLNFNTAANYMAGVCTNYTKIMDHDTERARHYPVFFVNADSGPKFDPNFENHTTVYHIGTRANMYDELYAAARLLPTIPPEFIKNLKEFGDRVIDDTEITLMTTHETPERGCELLNTPFVTLVCRTILKSTTSIMINATALMNHEMEAVREMGLQTMIAACRYLERIGITPTTVEGSSEFGNTWFDLKKMRMRDVEAKIVWYDHFTKQEITTRLPFYNADNVRRDRNS